MEVASLAIGVASLAGLVTVCVDLLERVETYKNTPAESRLLMTRFDINKVIFRAWAKHVGIVSGHALNEAKHHPLLDDAEVGPLVYRTLLCIRDIFSATEASRISLDQLLSDLDRDEPPPLTSTSSGGGPKGLSSAAAKTLNPKKSHSVLALGTRKAKLGWALGGKNRFSAQVEAFEALLERLRALVPPSRPDDSEKSHDDQLTQNTTLLEDIRKMQETETRKAIANWLGATAITHQFYDSCLSARLVGTCEWVLAAPVFDQWAAPAPDNGAAKLLWINGPAGFGKTILAASLIQHVKSSSPDDQVAFFFFSAAAVVRSDPVAVIRTWTAQMVATSDVAFRLAADHAADKETRIASASEVWSLFAAIAQNVPRCVFVLDGLDECAHADDRRSNFLATLKRSVAGSTSRLLIVSRDEPDIRSELCASPSAAKDGDDDHDEESDDATVSTPASERAGTVLPAGLTVTELPLTEDDVRDDVARFSRSVVDRKLPNKDRALRQTLAADMARKSAGMFLWIELQKERLGRGRNAKQLQQAVQQMPAGLARAYERNWAEILRRDAGEQCRALAVLRWAAFALRPLTVREIADALVVQASGDDDNDDDAADNDSDDDDGGGDLAVDELPDKLDKYYVEDQIVDLCRALVVVRGAAPQLDAEPASSFDAASQLDMATIHLAHFSVREFLLAAAPPLLLGGINRLPFADQAAQNNHLAALCLRYAQYRRAWEDEDGTLRTRPFLDYAARLWHRHTHYGGSGYKAVSAQVKGFFHQENAKWIAWRDFIESAGAEDSADDPPDTYLPSGPLYYAALYGLTDVVDDLCAKHGADINAVGGKYGTALQAASAKGHADTVERLIGLGADFNQKAGKYGCALNAAAGEGHEVIVRRFIREKASQDIRDPAGRSSLYLASWLGNRGIVQVLLDNGADVAAPSNSGNTPLGVAASRGYVEVVRLLLDHGADMSVAEKDGWLPLTTAADEGHLEAVKLLLDRGADLSARTRNGWTSLQCAADEGHVEVVKLLLDRGADISARNMDGWTALQCAADEGHVEVVKLLLERGADMSSSAIRGTTSLFSAASSGHLEVVRLLLDRGADVSAADDNGWTPLTAAACEGRLEVVGLLLERGAAVSWAIHGGPTPLVCAACRGHVNVVRVLLDGGADISLGDGDGWTPLNCAAWYGHLEVVKLLLARGADMSPTTSGQTPLHSAAQEGHVEVAQRLLEHEANAAAVATDGWTPLRCAASKGHIDLVRLLLDHGADVSAVYDNGQTPLHVAAEHKQVAVVRLLVDRGADLSVADNNRWTPLHVAAQLGDPDAVKVLLDAGAAPTVQDDRGRTPLMFAAANYNIELAKMLLDKGADRAATDVDGFTALKHAVVNGHCVGNNELVTLLLDREAEMSAVSGNGATPH